MAAGPMALALTAHMVKALMAPARKAVQVTTNTAEGSNKSMKAVIKTYLILTIIGGIAFVLSLFAGISPCIIYHVTGLPCPACGLTRAFISLAHLEWRQAFFYHPLFFLAPLVPLLMLERVPPRWRNILSFAVLGVFFAVWIVRMVLFFPDTPPLDYNSDSLFEWVFRR